MDTDLQKLEDAEQSGLEEDIILPSQEEAVPEEKIDNKDPEQQKRKEMKNRRDQEDEDRERMQYVFQNTDLIVSPCPMNKILVLLQSLGVEFHRGTIG